MPYAGIGFGCYKQNTFVNNEIGTNYKFFYLEGTKINTDGSIPSPSDVSSDFFEPLLGSVLYNVGFDNSVNIDENNFYTIVVNSYSSPYITEVINNNTLKINSPDFGEIIVTREIPMFTAGIYTYNSQTVSFDDEFISPPSVTLTWKNSSGTVLPPLVSPTNITSKSFTIPSFTNTVETQNDIYSDFEWSANGPCVDKYTITVNYDSSMYAGTYLVYNMSNKKIAEFVIPSGNTSGSTSFMVKHSDVTNYYMIDPTVLVDANMYIADSNADKWFDTVDANNIDCKLTSSDGSVYIKITNWSNNISFKYENND